MRSITDMGDIAGKRVLLRLDLNVPMDNGHVSDDFRIRKSMPTIEYLRDHGAKIVILSHCEGKAGKEEEKPPSLRPVFELMKKSLPVSFMETYVNDATTNAVNALNSGEMILLENLRMHPGEKKNDLEFSKSLASLGDFFVNEAFSVSHREHASVVGVPKFLPHFAGLLFQNEIQNLSKAFNPLHPFLFVLGGAKFSTKMPLVEKFLGIADEIFIGGALANDFFKAMGYEVGKSVVSDGSLDLSALVGNKKIILPKDVVVKTGETMAVRRATEVKEDEYIFDAGPESLKDLEARISGAKLVLWNGPLGNFEAGFEEGTVELAQKIAKSSAETIVGGADTLAAIAALGIEEKFGFVSSGGGAMLDFLANGTLPGIEALSSTN